MKRLFDFIKRETVLSISLLLAILSSFVVHPDREYLEYLDVRTLAVLFSLMAVMAGLQGLGMFSWVAEKLLGRVKRTGEIIFILVMLCFFFSMVITNDVALITFVPFTFTVLHMMGEEQGGRLLIPTVVMQTVAANLGSMLTPIGNPQNLYLYGKAGMSVGEFLLLMLPYTMLSFVLLALWCVMQGRRFNGCVGNGKGCGMAPEDRNGGKGCGTAPEDGNGGMAEAAPVDLSIRRGLSQSAGLVGKGRMLVFYGILFLLCLLSVARILPYWVTFIAVSIGVGFADGDVLRRVDYSLLLTFVGFFIFIGNMGRIPAFRAFLEEIIAGHEVLTSVTASQVISNVPAALLLSGFTEDMKGLIVGTNLGGLGTLIASMASLISFKYIGREKKNLRGPYLLYFTVVNVCFLAALMLLFALIRR